MTKDERRIYDQRPDIKAKKRAYYQTSEYKAKKKEYRQKPEVKARDKEYRKQYFQRPEAKAKRQAYMKIWGKAYYQRPEVKERQKARKKEYYQRPEVKTHHKEYSRHYLETHPKYLEKVKIRMKKYHQQHQEIRREERLQVISHYSEGRMECACCGEKRIEFLSVDHINGDGNKQRREQKYGTGFHFYHWLIKHNFPQGFQILCFNCNCAKGFWGYCPHENEREEEYKQMRESAKEISNQKIKR